MGRRWLFVQLKTVSEIELSLLLFIVREGAIQHHSRLLIFLTG